MADCKTYLIEVDNCCNITVTCGGQSTIYDKLITVGLDGRVTFGNSQGWSSYRWDQFAGYYSAQQFIDYLRSSCPPCGGDDTMMPEFQSISHFQMCRISDCEKVMIEACKDSVGNISYKDILTGGTVSLSDYEICDKADNYSNIKEYEVEIDVATPSGSQVLLEKYDAIQIENQGNCDLLVTLNCEDKQGTPSSKKVLVRAGQVKVYDWSSDVVTGFTVEAAPDLTGTGVVDVDTLSGVVPNEMIRAIISLLNS